MTLPCLAAIVPNLAPVVLSLVSKWVILVPLSLVAVLSAVISDTPASSLPVRRLKSPCKLESRFRVVLAPVCLSLNRRRALVKARPNSLCLVAVRLVVPVPALVAVAILLSRINKLVRLFLKAPIVLRVLLALVRVPDPTSLKVL